VTAPSKTRPESGASAASKTNGYRIVVSPNGEHHVISKDIGDTAR
jgi:hypothetical protein